MGSTTGGVAKGFEAAIDSARAFLYAASSVSLPLLRFLVRQIARASWSSRDKSMLSSATSRYRDRIEKAQHTREIGLELGYRLLKFALKTEHLHYGLFEPDIPVDFSNIKVAQDRYVQRLVELIPAGTRTILDVGCGTGKMAEHLLEKGYTIDCVSPGLALTAFASERLGARATIYRDRYETVSIPKRYDLILFSESFQYIPLDVGIAKSVSLLNPGGHILICDFFDDPSKGKSPIGGGHPFPNWCKMYPQQPIDLVVERDITNETAPVHDIVQAFMQEVARPMWEKSFSAAAMRWPLPTRLVRFFFRKRIKRMEQRRITTVKDGASFRHHKIYKTYLFKVRAEVPVGPGAAS
jgi:SAM-dependent methyltransferase